MKSPVFLIRASHDEGPERIEKKLKRLLTDAGFDSLIPEKGLVAVKTHFGEKKSVTHIPPHFFKPISARIKQAGGRPFLTETSTLYKGSRSDALCHTLHALDHGFSVENTGMPIVMADGLKGEWESEVALPKRPDKKVKVAGMITRIHALVCVSHPTGHIALGYGGAIKNLGMGLSSRKGKLTMHSSIKPSIDSERCTGCKHCMNWCPENAITLNGYTVVIDESKCIGCGECLTECRFDAVRYNWEMDKTEIQKLTAEHAVGVTNGKPCFYINYAIRFTKDCDCYGTAKEAILKDIGIFASQDPVAIDEACITLLEAQAGKPLCDITYPDRDVRIQTRYGEAIGLGSRDYELIEVAL
ncbi:MAG: hypothetical protein A2293_14255 [Elusimicrobia bacterium RIFOXYB2_FULL_49_7]|nr:MAG: hypothetical protein A2293_14255 [Elusimicrobia bacterium RIFOXYB2_FULL_49_7]